MKSLVALSIVGLTLALPGAAMPEEMSSEMFDSVDMLEMEDASTQATQDMSEEFSEVSLRYLEEDSTDNGLYVVPEETAPSRVLGKKSRMVYVAAPKKYVAPPVVHKKAAPVHSKYSAPLQKSHMPTKKAPVVTHSKYSPPTVSKYTPAAPSKKWRRLQTSQDEMIEKESTATSVSDSEMDEDERELRNRGYYVAYAPMVGSPYCTVGSSCARYLSEEDMSEEPMIEEEEIVYEQSVPERSLGKKGRAVYVAAPSKKYAAPAPQKKVATPVYRAAPLQKKAPVVTHSKYYPTVTSSKYTPVTTSKKWRRLATDDDFAIEEESSATDFENEGEVRDLKKRRAYYYPVSKKTPVVAAPYCKSGVCH